MVERAVCDTLGLEAADLTSEVSLVDDLAVDSLDLLQLAIAIEGDLCIELDDRELERVRSYGDLLLAVEAAIETAKRRAARAPTYADPIPFRARLGARSRTLVRTGVLTPYAAELLTEDALAMAPDGNLEIVVPAATSDAALADVHGQLAGLRVRGIRLTVRRDFGTARRT